MAIKIFDVGSHTYYIRSRGRRMGAALGVRGSSLCKSIRTFQSIIQT
jgi:hypothetical protein